MGKNPDQIIAEYCELSGKVAKYFSWQYSADCFCQPVKKGWNWKYENKVLDFIRDAVQEKMQREGKPKSRWEECI